MAWTNSFARGLSCLSLVALVAMLAGCEPDVEPKSSATKNVKETARPSLLVFPTKLRSDDASVNDFVEHAMKTCAAGDYDQFRLLWATTEDPIPRGDYEEGWQAVMEIRIRTVKAVLLDGFAKVSATGRESAHVLVADVHLDPAHPAGRREPTRQVVLLTVRENDQWRLAAAPKVVRTWALEQIETSDSPDEGAVSHDKTNHDRHTDNEQSDNPTD